MHRPSRGAKAAGVAWLIDMTWGVRNFLNFTFSALLGPVFGGILRRVAGDQSPMRLEHYQTAFAPLLLGVALAVVLAFVLRETGTAGRKRAVAVEEVKA